MLAKLTRQIVELCLRHPVLSRRSQLGENEWPAMIRIEIVGARNQVDMNMRVVGMFSKLSQIRLWASGHISQRDRNRFGERAEVGSFRGGQVGQAVAVYASDQDEPSEVR